MVSAPAPPPGAGRPDEDFVEWVAGNVADFAAMPGGQRYAVDGVDAMPCDTGESGLFIEAEVVGIDDGGDELRRAGRVEGGPEPTIAATPGVTSVRNRGRNFAVALRRSGRIKG